MYTEQDHCDGLPGTSRVEGGCREVLHTKLALRDPLDFLENFEEAESVWRSKYSSVTELVDKVIAVLVDQAKWRHLEDDWNDREESVPRYGGAVTDGYPQG